MSLVAGRTAGLWVIAAMIVTWAYATARFRKGDLKVKSLAALDAIDEAIGRAAEMGKPIHYAPGSKPLAGVGAADVAAGLSLLEFSANKAATKGVRMICSIRYPEFLPIVNNMLRSAYHAAGRGELYSDTDSVRYLSTQQMAFASGAVELMHREKVAANLMLGPFTGDTLVIAEGGRQAGAMQIGGMSEIDNIPFLIATCDYVLVGEELFVAAAAAEGNVQQIAGVRSQDLMKLGVVAIIVAGIVLKMAGVADLSKILRI